MVTFVFFGTYDMKATLEHLPEVLHTDNFKISNIETYLR